LKQIVAETKAKTGLFLPDTLSSLSSSVKGLEAISSLDCVSFVGMPLPTNVGDKISQVVRLQSSIGLTETGYFSTLQPLKREDWEYFEWNPNHPVEMRFYDDKCSQLVVPRPAGRFTHCAFLVLPNHREFCTGDLFTQHTENPALWKHVGRCDDISKLQNRVLLYPHPIETTLTGHNLVSKAIVTTDHALRVLVIIEPTRDNQHIPKDVANAIWPLIQRINKNLPREAQIAKDRILIAPSSKPFQTTAKGTVQRRLVVQSHSKDIEAISALGDV
jgi:hypothetical protein